VEEALSHRDVTTDDVLKVASAIADAPAAVKWTKSAKHTEQATIVAGCRTWTLMAHPATQPKNQRRTVLHTLFISMVHERDACPCTGGPCPAGAKALDGLGT
jgi:hypothetical protein